jgi:hypothetical protein
MAVTQTPRKPPLETQRELQAVFAWAGHKVNPLELLRKRLPPPDGFDYKCVADLPPEGPQRHWYIEVMSKGRPSFVVLTETSDRTGR